MGLNGFIPKNLNKIIISNIRLTPHFVPHFFKMFPFRIRRVKRLENAMETQRITPKVAQESKITPKSKWDISGSKQKKGSAKRIQ